MQIVLIGAVQDPDHAPLCSKALEHRKQMPFTQITPVCGIFADGFLLQLVDREHLVRSAQLRCHPGGNLQVAGRVQAAVKGYRIHRLPPPGRAVRRQL